MENTSTIVWKVNRMGNLHKLMDLEAAGPPPAHSSKNLHAIQDSCVDLYVHVTDNTRGADTSIIC